MGCGRGVADGVGWLQRRCKEAVEVEAVSLAERE